MHQQGVRRADFFSILLLFPQFYQYSILMQADLMLRNYESKHKLERIRKSFLHTLKCINLKKSASSQPLMKPLNPSSGSSIRKYFENQEFKQEKFINFFTQQDQKFLPVVPLQKCGRKQKIFFLFEKQIQKYLPNINIKNIPKSVPLTAHKTGSIPQFLHISIKDIVNKDESFNKLKQLKECIKLTEQSSQNKQNSAHNALELSQNRKLAKKNKALLSIIRGDLLQKKHIPTRKKSLNVEQTPRVLKEKTRLTEKQQNYQVCRWDHIQDSSMAEIDIVFGSD